MVLQIREIEHKPRKQIKRSQQRRSPARLRPNRRIKRTIELSPQSLRRKPNQPGNLKA